MKTILILLFSILPILGCCQEKENNIHFGLKAGFGLSTLNPGNYIDNAGYKHRYNRVGGVRGGIFLEIHTGKKMLFQPELLFAVKGTRETIEYYNGNPQSNDPVRINYIEIPLNLLVKLVTKNGFFIAGGGPMPAFSSNKYSPYATSFDIGVNFLAGYQLPMGFSFNLHFTKGFSNVLKEYYNSSNLKNNSFGLSLGYTF